jgi:hypothetical protein
MIRRSIAFVILGVGCAVLLAAVAKVLPGASALGGGLAFCGAVLLGLSFVRSHTAAPDAPPPMTAAERLSGIFFDPADTFRNLRAHPRWLVPVLIIGLFSVIYSTTFTQRITPERVVNYTSDKLAESGFVPPEQVEIARRQQLESARAPLTRITNVSNTMVFSFIAVAFVSLLYWLGIVVFGGRINYWQALAVTAHAWLPATVIQKSLSLLLLYLKEPDDIHPVLDQTGLVKDNLGILFSPAQHPVLFVAAGSLGLLTFYTLWLTATGLRNGGERVNSGAAWSVTLGFWLLAVLLGIGWTALFPQFIS